MLRSPHVNKTARDQFETRVYKYIIILEINNYNKKIISNFINNLNLNGISITIEFQFN